MAKSNLLNRKAGNFVPKEPYKSEDDSSKERVETTHITKTKPQLGKRRKNIKVSDEMKNSIAAIKTIKGFSYNYEVISMLIDFYMQNETESNKKKYELLKEMH